MRPLWTALAIALLAAGVTVGHSASAADPANRRSMGNLRFDDNTAGRAIQGSTPYNGGNRAFFVPGATRGNYPVRQYYAPSPYGYGYYPSYNNGYYPQYGYSRGYYRGYFYPPPIYLPAERLYGPQAMRRFMGAR